MKRSMMLPNAVLAAVALIVLAAGYAEFIKLYDHELTKAYQCGYVHGITGHGQNSGPIVCGYYRKMAADGGFGPSDRP
jgi:hypothetical protein